MTSIDQLTKSDGSSTIQRERQPLRMLSLNHRQFLGAPSLNPNALDEREEYVEDVDAPENVSTMARGVYHFGEYDPQRVAESLSFEGDPNVVYPLKSLNIPSSWNHHLKAVPVLPNETRSMRDCYPLPQQQRQFVERDATRSPTVAEAETFNLGCIPPFEGELPPFPLHYLIIAAINGSPSLMLTERQIKLALIRRFPYFADRLARNSRWQISVNWILSRYKCFQAVTCEPTPEDDGCAYRVVQKGKHREIPIHALFPIDFGESIGDLSKKPKRAPRDLSSPPPSPSLSTSAVYNLELKDDHRRPSPLTSPIALNSGDSSSLANFEKDQSPVRAASLSLRETLGHLMIRPTGSIGDEFTLAPILGEESSRVQNLPSLSEEIQRLERRWPSPVSHQPVAVPPRDLIGAAPSLWIQSLLFESVKGGSHELAKRHLTSAMEKRARNFFE